MELQNRIDPTRAGVGRAGELTERLPDALRDVAVGAILAVLREPLLGYLRETSMNPDQLPETPRRPPLPQALRGSRSRASPRASARRCSRCSPRAGCRPRPRAEETTTIAAYTDAHMLDQWIVRAAFPPPAAAPRSRWLEPRQRYQAGAEDEGYAALAGGIEDGCHHLDGRFLRRRRAAPCSWSPSSTSGKPAGRGSVRLGRKRPVASGPRGAASTGGIDVEKSVPDEDERTSLDEFVTHLVWMIDSMRRHGIDIMGSPEFAGGPGLIVREHVRRELRNRAGKIDPQLQTGAGLIERAVDDAVQTIAGHGKPDGTGARYARAFIRRIAQDAERYIARQNALTREEAILAALNNRGHASLVNRGDAWFPAYDQIAAAILHPLENGPDSARRRADLERKLRSLIEPCLGDRGRGWKKGVVLRDLARQAIRLAGLNDANILDAAGKMREHRQKPDVKMRETPPRKRRARRR